VPSDKNSLKDSYLIPVLDAPQGRMVENIFLFWKYAQIGIGMAFPPGKEFPNDCVKKWGDSCAT
jgi:hypothetical protein